MKKNNKYDEIDKEYKIEKYVIGRGLVNRNNIEFLDF